MKKDDLELFIDQKKAESPEFAENFEEGYLNFKIGAILRQAREQVLTHLVCPVSRLV